MWFPTKRIIGNHGESWRMENESFSLKKNAVGESQKNHKWLYDIMLRHTIYKWCYFSGCPGIDLKLGIGNVPYSRRVCFIIKLLLKMACCLILLIPLISHFSRLLFYYFLKLFFYFSEKVGNQRNHFILTIIMLYRFICSIK